MENGELRMENGEGVSHSELRMERAAAMLIN